MNRRQVLKAGLAAGVSSGLPTFSPALAGAPSLPLYDDLLERSLLASPQNATLYALDTGARASLKRRLDERGPANRLKLYGPLLQAAPALAAQPSQSDPRRRQWLEMTRWFADASRRMADFADLTVDQLGYPIPYAVSQLTGAFYEVPDLLANQHTIETQADCEAYIDRLGAFGRAVEQDTETSRVQAAAGLVPPDFVCDGALAAVAALAAQHGAQASMVQALTVRARRAGIAGDWERRATTLVDGPIAAALARQHAHLADLRRRARPEAGLGARPGGDARYAMMLRFHTTVDSTPREIHRLGLEQVAAGKAEIDAMLIRLGHAGGTIGARLVALGKDPAQLFANDDAGRVALLAYVRERSDDMKRRLATVFNRIPRTPIDIRRIPVETEAGSPLAYSLPGSPDGARPGTIYFNLADTANWPRWQLPTTIYHEGWPGHQYAGAVLVESGGTPLLLNLLVPNAYNEGWALYAELLADELGVYNQAPIGRLGRLQADLFRSCRLVVDTGLHAFGWSRERAIAYLVEEGGQLPGNARREIDRYVVWPGQACSYKLGQLEFLRQREHAKARLGGSFSIKAFHDAVLLGGGMPLSVMAQVVAQNMNT